MSSILEALKKASTEKKEGQEKTQTTPFLLTTPSSFASQVFQALARRLVLLVFLALLALAVSWGISQLQLDRISQELPQEPSASLPKLKKVTSQKIQPALESPSILSGIFWDPQEPFAIIDSKLVKVGDTVGGGTVLKISQTQVQLTVEGTPQILSLEKE